MTTLDEVGDFLETEVGLSIETDLFLGFMPDTDGLPSKVVALYEEPGSSPVETFGTEVGTLRPRLQVLVRGDEPVSTEGLAWEIWTALTVVVEQDLLGTRYHRISGVGSAPMPLGEDKEGRYQFSLNFDCWKELSAVVS
jgi:hypothetical protein